MSVWVRILGVSTNCSNLPTSNSVPHHPHYDNPNSTMPQTLSTNEPIKPPSNAECSTSLDTNAHGTDMETAEHSEKTKTTGHGPWMLMSYKNRKVNPNKVPANSAPTQSGSRYALLETFVETENGALTEIQPTTVESLTSKKIQEPGVVSTWKKVQKKIKKTISDTSKHTAASSKSANKAKANTAQKMPLSDITNGKPIPRQFIPKFNMGSTSNQSSQKDTANQQTTKLLAASQSAPFESTHVPDSVPTVQESHPQVNISASYGNCPPEPTLESSCLATVSTESTTSKGQVCSVLTPNNDNDMIVDVLIMNATITSDIEAMVDL
ncbi:hypothetical protein M0R45_031184 [Rubus argutus]|uniref:Uncharacterized protein n=1 Tax=Rubus argutus TaxID=59490 RepID=A0AAW1WFM5_RUBAR